MRKYAIRNTATRCWWNLLLKNWVCCFESSNCFFDTWDEAEKELMTFYNNKNRPMDESWEIVAFDIIL